MNRIRNAVCNAVSNNVRNAVARCVQNQNQNQTVSYGGLVVSMAEIQDQSNGDLGLGEIGFGVDR